MKAIIYTGAVLMVAAAIYGFADLSKNKPTEVTNEIKTEKSKAGEDASAAMPVVPVKEEKKAVAPKRKSVKRETDKEVAAEKELLPIRSEVPVASVTEAITEEATTLKENTNGAKIEAAKKKKRVRSKMFSRAPLSEEYIEEVPKVKKSKL